MPSLRKRVSSYFRQLSFYNEPREKKHNINENSFVTKYLEGHISIKEGPPILYGKNPTDLPNYDLGAYEVGPNTIIGCYSGPNGGLTTVKRLEKHLSIPDTDIDFIDTQDEPEADNASTNSDAHANTNDSILPEDWNRKSDHIYGISDSLYDRNQVTKNKNGDPIADCFGIIARNDSAILAVADGVNWGEKASIAAKSAVHGCLHYLDKTIFNDTKPFDDLSTKSELSQKTSAIFSQNRISNTREVFVCLLRAFNCAHDLILENEGMLTTLTVAVILPLKPKNVKGSTKSKEQGDSLNRDKPRRPQAERPRPSENTESYVCCVCNVGDTLAYVYSQKYGVRELTKGSHDVNCNRDMRDALGALGPVDGINPELSNLTLSVTIIQKGDIILVASDGLTDNFDPNVCKFTVNSKETTTRLKRPSTSREGHHNKENINVETEKPSSSSQGVQTTPTDVSSKIPIKPPRKNKDNLSRSSRERSVDSIETKDDPSSHIDQNKVKEIPGESHEGARNNQASIQGPNKSSGKSESDDFDNPLVAQFMRENSLDDKTNIDKPKKRASLETQQRKTSTTKKPSSSHTDSLKAHTKSAHNEPKTLPNQPKVHVHKTASRNIPLNKTMEQRAIDLKRSGSRAKELQSNSKATGFLRSKTSLDMRTSAKTILRNEDGVPFVTPVQRYEISLLLMEDVLKHGISGHDPHCTTAKKLCENLVNFTFSISSAKRHTLEDTDLYFDNIDGVLVEVSQQEKKMRRRKGLERVQNLPGKLDHVSVVAYNVGNFAY